MRCLICHLNQAFSGSPVPSLDASSPTEEATVWTPWTSRMTLEAGALTWTWSSSTSTQSTGSLASSYSASSATSSSLLFDSPGNSEGATQKEERLKILKDVKVTMMFTIKQHRERGGGTKLQFGRTMSEFQAACQLVVSH